MITIGSTRRPNASGRFFCENELVYLHGESKTALQSHWRKRKVCEYPEKGEVGKDEIVSFDLR